MLEYREREWAGKKNCKNGPVADDAFPAARRCFPPAISWSGADFDRAHKFLALELRRHAPRNLGSSRLKRSFALWIQNQSQPVFLTCRDCTQIKIVDKP